MPLPSVFGEIPGYGPGSTFGSRAELKTARLHRHLMRGISGNPQEGADAIVVSGGYADDEDFGDTILYTGEGGQSSPGGTQVADQTMTGGNLALVRAEQEGLPVRVIRGAGGDPAYAPSSGYRYDGLYRVEGHLIEPSRAGPLVYRYWLVKEMDDAPWTGPATPPPPSTPHPPRAPSVIQRIVRNSAVTQAVKHWHDHECQVCGVRLELPGGRYAEGAHIRPLGRPHSGPDTTENILCLCPNDHVLLDQGAIYVNAAGDVIRTLDGFLLGPLRTTVTHAVSTDHLSYHREQIAGQ